MFAKPLHSLITFFSGISEVGCSQLIYKYLLLNLKKKCTMWHAGVHHFAGNSFYFSENQNQNQPFTDLSTNSAVSIFFTEVLMVLSTSCRLS